MNLDQFGEYIATGLSQELAKQVAEEMKKLISVPAPTKMTRSGKLVATKPAIPYAPPRKVNGNLLRAIKVENNKIVIDPLLAPYAWFLENSTQRNGFPHKFIEPALKNLGLMK